jgi:hypothetical protein
MANPSAQYRVVKVTKMRGRRNKMLTVERVKKPIKPVVDES